jgi:hypothetical protein
LDSVDRGKKQCNLELAEARSVVNDMSIINSKALTEKRHLESVAHTLVAEIDDMLRQAKNSEEKTSKAMIDASRLADELRCEQDHTIEQEKAKRALEAQISELGQRLIEANEMASRSGQKALVKLESRIRQLEIELGSCQSKTSETFKAFQKSERKVKELQFQQEEDHKNQVIFFKNLNSFLSEIKGSSIISSAKVTLKRVAIKVSS